MVVEKTLNYPIQLIEGSYKNIKITTPEDLELAKSVADGLLNLIDGRNKRCKALK